jgi:hypothetical protein
MTTTGAQSVLDRISVDEAFAEQIKDAGEAGGPAAALALQQSEGFEVTAEEMRDAVLDRFGDQLSQVLLDALAGGQYEHLGYVAAGTGMGLIVGVAIAAAV